MALVQAVYQHCQALDVNHVYTIHLSFNYNISFKLSKCSATSECFLEKTIFRSPLFLTNEFAFIWRVCVCPNLCWLYYIVAYSSFLAASGGVRAYLAVLKLRWSYRVRLWVSKISSACETLSNAALQFESKTPLSVFGKPCMQRHQPTEYDDYVGTIHRYDLSKLMHVRIFFSFDHYK